MTEEDVEQNWLGVFVIGILICLVLWYLGAHPGLLGCGDHTVIVMDGVCG